MDEALAIQRESEVIVLTGWTFDEYDEADGGRLARLMMYQGMKHTVEQEKQRLDSGRGGRG